MKSQKQRNRAPRPFKSKGNNRGWSDGGSFIPVSKKPAVSTKKATEGDVPDTGDKGAA